MSVCLQSTYKSRGQLGKQVLQEGMYLPARRDSLSIGSWGDRSACCTIASSSLGPVVRWLGKGKAQLVPDWTADDSGHCGQEYRLLRRRTIGRGSFDDGQSVELDGVGAVAKGLVVKQSGASAGKAALAD